MKQEIKETLSRINQDYNIDDEDYNDLIIKTHTGVQDNSGYEGSYHFWVDEGGFIRGDASEQDIEADLERFGFDDIGDLMDYLNAKFVRLYERNVIVTV
jgi:hypothetical protein